MKSPTLSGRVSIRLAAAASIQILPLALAGQDRPDSSRSAGKPLEAVVVSATRTEQSLKSLPAHVVVLGAPAIAASAAQTVPDLLRSIPGFTTRDYQSGMVAGPSQSIVSFRGLGGSSAGRALVLIDGIPAGDPFSGWLDWSRIPLPMLQSAEVVRGGSSTIWGSRSLGGVVNLRTIDPRRDAAQVTLEGGSLGTYHATGAASVRRGTFSASLGGDFWNTDGFVILRKDQAGPIDARQATASRAVSGKTTWDATPALQLWAGGGAYYGGDRPLGDEDNARFDEGRGGLRWLAPGGGIATVALFTNHRRSKGKSYTINSARTTQTPQRYGDSPARSTGVSLQWTQMALTRHEISAGSDVSFADGSYDEQYTFVGDRATRSRDVSGKQQILGVFVQDAAELGAGVHMVASLRADRVANRDGRRVASDLTLGTVLSDSAFRDETASRLTYSFGLRWQQTGWLGWRASAYEAFRAPSMYEMYYPRFSSRGTVTEANAALDPERLNGIEAGLDLTPGKGFLSRVTVYRNRVASPIMDVTIGTAGALPQVIQPCGLMPARQTCSQRRNVSGLRSNGLETEMEWRLTPTWGVGGSYAYSPTHLIAPGQPVDGNSAIRAARHTVSSNVRFDSPRWLSGAIEVRHVGSRYDDDLNEVKLDGFYLVGLRLNRSLRRGVTAHLKIENLLDEEFEIARTRAGLADMGAPRWITAGLRAAW
jgi:outer membrane cobalamin receptor